MNKQWRPWTDADCPECGNDTSVFTNSDRDGIAYDGDAVKCVDPNCPARGTVSVDDDADGIDGESGAHTIWSDP